LDGPNLPKTKEKIKANPLGCQANPLGLLGSKAVKVIFLIALLLNGNLLQKMSEVFLCRVLGGKRAGFGVANCP